MSIVLTVAQIIGGFWMIGIGGAGVLIAIGAADRDEYADAIAALVGAVGIGLIGVLVALAPFIGA